jgi:PhnB protein
MAARKTRARNPAKKTAARKAPLKKAAPKKAAARKAAPKRAAKATPAARQQPKHIPKGYNVITAYLAVDGAKDAIDFYKRVFGAKERMRMDAPEGRVGHAELVIGDSVIMLADVSPEFDFFDPKKYQGTPVNMHLYVPDVDTMVANAVDAGARLVRAVEDKFYGDRGGTIQDPFGHVWSLATHKEDLSPAEMKRRGEAASKKGQG